MTRYTADTIERIRRVSRECGYNSKLIAKHFSVSDSTVWDWASRGWVSAEHRSLSEIRTAQRREQVRDAIVRCHGDMRDIARELCLTHRAARALISQMGMYDLMVASSRERRCKLCGAAFRRPERNRVYCSAACQDEAQREHARLRHERRRGADAFTPHLYERIAEEMRTALWDACGNVAKAARLMRKSRNAAYQYIRHHPEIRPHLEKCRNRLRNPDELRLLLEEHGWDRVAAAASLGYAQRFLIQRARAAGMLDAMRMRPCIECGRMHSRTGPVRTRTVCSDECRRVRNARWHRERSARKKLQQQQGDSCIRA